MSDLHGMVLVSQERAIVPTCLCGWIGPSNHRATGFSKSRDAWRGHVELEERLSTMPIEIEVGVPE